ncbi:FAD-dependent oxidoreductase [Escherichia coli]
MEYTWTGNFLLTLSRLPQFGRIGHNIYYMQGYSGHGVTCTHLAGKLLSEVLSGQAERFDAFARLPHYPSRVAACCASPSPPPAPPGTPCAIDWAFNFRLTVKSQKV